MTSLYEGILRGLRASSERTAADQRLEQNEITQQLRLEQADRQEQLFDLQLDKAEREREKYFQDQARIAQEAPLRQLRQQTELLELQSKSEGLQATSSFDELQRQFPRADENGALVDPLTRNRSIFEAARATGDQRLMDLAAQDLATETVSRVNELSATNPDQAFNLLAETGEFGAGATAVKIGDEYMFFDGNNNMILRGDQREAQAFIQARATDSTTPLDKLRAEQRAADAATAKTNDVNKQKQLDRESRERAARITARGQNQRAANSNAVRLATAAIRGSGKGGSGGTGSSAVDQALAGGGGQATGTNPTNGAPAPAGQAVRDAVNSAAGVDKRKPGATAPERIRQEADVTGDVGNDFENEDPLDGEPVLNRLGSAVLDINRSAGENNAAIVEGITQAGAAVGSAISDFVLQNETITTSPTLLRLRDLRNDNEALNNEIKEIGVDNLTPDQARQIRSNYQYKLSNDVKLQLLQRIREGG